MLSLWSMKEVLCFYDTCTSLDPLQSKECFHLFHENVENHSNRSVVDIYFSYFFKMTVKQIH